MPSKVGLNLNGRIYEYTKRSDCDCMRNQGHECHWCMYFTQSENKRTKSRHFRLHSPECGFCERTRIESSGWTHISMYTRASFGDDDMTVAKRIAEQRFSYYQTNETKRFEERPDVVDAAIAVMTERYLGRDTREDDFYYPKALMPFSHLAATYQTKGLVIHDNKHLLRIPSEWESEISEHQADITILGGVYPNKTHEVYLNGYMPRWAWAGYVEKEGGGPTMAVYRGPLMPMQDVVDGKTVGYCIDEPRAAKAAPARKSRAKSRTASPKTTGG